MTAVLALRPACPAWSAHGAMSLRNQDRQTPEQFWCGVWFDCGRCRSSVLYQSEAMAKALYAVAPVTAAATPRVLCQAGWGDTHGQDMNDGIECERTARYAVHLDDFYDFLACGWHLDDACEQAVGLSHGLGCAEVFLIAPRPDAAYPHAGHPHSGFECVITGPRFDV